MSIAEVSRAAHEVVQTAEVAENKINGGGKGLTPVEGLGTGGLAKEVPKVDIEEVNKAIKTWTARVANVSDNTPSFKGFRNTALIADRQTGPTCGYEALENGIQLVINDKGGANNQLSTVMRKMVAQDPLGWGAGKVVYEGKSYWALPFCKYTKMLGEFKIDSSLSHFSHEKLQHALTENRPVIICGDVGYLPQQYDQNGMHAVIVTDWDKQSGLYTIVDSNFPKESYRLDSQTLERFVNGSLPDDLKNSEYGNMVVINNQAAWDDVGNGGSVSFGGRMSESEYRKAMDAADKMEKRGDHHGAEKLRSEAAEARRSGVGARSSYNKTWDENHRR